MGGNVRIKSGNVLDILPPTTTTATGDWKFKDAPQSAFQAVCVGTSATVVIEASNDGINAVATPLGTITLSGATLSDGFTTNAPWKYVRARVTAITGTVNVMMGV